MVGAQRILPLNPAVKSSPASFLCSRFDLFLLHFLPHEFHFVLRLVALLLFFNFSLQPFFVLLQSDNFLSLSFHRSDRGPGLFRFKLAGLLCTSLGPRRYFCRQSIVFHFFPARTLLRARGLCSDFGSRLGTFRSSLLLFGHFAKIKRCCRLAEFIALFDLNPHSLVHCPKHTAI